MSENYADVLTGALHAQIQSLHKVLRVALDAEMSFPVHAYLNTAPTRWLVCAGLVFKSLT